MRDGQALADGAEDARDPGPARDEAEEEDGSQHGADENVDGGQRGAHETEEAAEEPNEAEEETAQRSRAEDSYGHAAGQDSVQDTASHFGATSSELQLCCWAAGEEQSKCTERGGTKTKKKKEEAKESCMPAAVPSVVGAHGGSANLVPASWFLPSDVSTHAAA